MQVFVELYGTSRVVDGPVSAADILCRFLHQTSINDFYVTKNGKILNDNDIVEECTVRIFPRLVGGKGGFGSMLRAIGAQIEKTTNREACRDLSGRRLRDINEEKRLKNWIAQQAEREREAAERRKKKLERLCVQPKHDFTDQNYEKERSELTEKVHDAVEQGFRSVASTSVGGSKRKHADQGPPQIKKKKGACLWVDVDEDEFGSDDSSDSDSEEKATKINGAKICLEIQPQQATGSESNKPESPLQLESNSNGETFSKSSIVDKPCTTEQDSVSVKESVVIPGQDDALSS